MSRPVVLWLAGMRWDGQEGTEVRLARALGRHVEVLWFDPVRSWFAVRREGRANPGRAVVAPGVTCVTTVGFPGVTRPGISGLSQRRLWTAVDAALAGVDGDAAGVVLSDPTGGFPPRASTAPRILFVTDDWPAGAEMMGVSRSRLDRFVQRNAALATSVVTVSPELARQFAARTSASVRVVANGCDPQSTGTAPATLEAPSPRVGVVGTLNERLDLGLLEAVADRGVSLVLVGPFRARSKTFHSRFEVLVSRPNVWWEGSRTADQIPGVLAALDVGVTPYADTPFNRASFPLKTLEYLAAGLPVVSTVLPANAWLDTDLIHEASDPAKFADGVVRVLESGEDPARTERSMRFARSHSWDARAVELLELLGLHSGRRDPALFSQPDLRR